MNKFSFFSICIFCFVATQNTLNAQAQKAKPEISLSVELLPSNTSNPISTYFQGFSYEIDILTYPKIFTPENKTLQSYFMQLGKGIIRLGANAVDETAWSREKRTESTGNKTLTPDDMDRFFNFIRPTGWKVIIGLNCFTSNPEIAADMAEYTSKIAGDLIYAYEIGNEPDLKGFDYKGNKYKSGTYSVNNYISDFNDFVKAVRSKVPNAPFSGPGATYYPSANVRTFTRGIDEWAIPFANEKQKDINLITFHTYTVGQPEGVLPEKDFVASISNLLSKKCNNTVALALDKLNVLSQKLGIPYRMTEGNSCYWGGFEGVSDVFASALWGADYMFTLAEKGSQGVNFHSGQKQYYTAIETKGFDEISILRPLYYGMMFFHLAGQGSFVGKKIDGPDCNVKIYPILSEKGDYSIAIINKELKKRATIKLDVGYTFGDAELVQLTAPKLDAKKDLRLGGLEILPNVPWEVVKSENAKLDGKYYTIEVPAATAVMIKLKSKKWLWD